LLAFFKGYYRNFYWNLQGVLHKRDGKLKMIKHLRNIGLKVEHALAKIALRRSERLII